MRGLFVIRHLFILLSQIIPALQAGQRFGNQVESGYTLSCLTVNCQTKWDPNCCSGAQQGVGRSMEPLANWRFGSIFRNSIPPVRPYNPPTFEDIFETDHKSEEDESTTKTPNRFSLQLNPFQMSGKQSNQQQNVFKFSNEFSEMDRNSESESTTSKFLSSLNQLKENQQQKLYGNQYETSTKAYRKQRTSTKLFENIKRTTNEDDDYETSTKRYKSTTVQPKEDLRNYILLQKAKQELLEKQRLKAIFIKAQQNKNKLKKLTGFIPKEKTKQVDISYLEKPSKEVSLIKKDFHGHFYQTNFNIAENEKEYDDAAKVKKKKDEATKTNGLKKAYTAKLAKWQQNKLKNRRQKFIDKSRETIIIDATAKEDTAPPVTTTYTPMTTEKLWLNKEEEQERISQEENENEIENFVKKDKGNTYKEKENQDTPFSEALCEKLRVPCRFVTEHPCCKFPQRIELVGRARSMDGSADLKWRFFESRPSEGISDYHIKADDDGGPRKGPQGRMITGFGGQSALKRPSSFTVKSTLSNILYNHSLSKDSVTVPRYHYDGGPKLTTSILQQCWRLSYLDCQLEPEHPCCALTSAKSNPHDDSLSTNVLDKWLRRQ